MSFMNWWVIRKDGNQTDEKKNKFIPKKTSSQMRGEPQKSLGPKEKAQICRGELALSFRECTFFLGEKVGARTKDNVFSAKL